MLKHDIEHALTEALIQCGLPQEAFTVERPTEEGRGDYASNAALICGKKAGRNPREVADDIIAALTQTDTGARVIAHAEAAGPGFINITVHDRAAVDDVGALTLVLEHGLDTRSGDTTHIEFISANPTGALHIGHGRGAFYGDALARVLSFAGARVGREYYINNSRESNQIKELGKTALGQGDTYRTDRVNALIDTLDFTGLDETDAGFLLASKIQEENQQFITDTLGIDFDVWYSEDENIRATDATDIVNAELKRKDLTYEADGALWLKTSEYGDDEDRVLVRSDGTESYFLSDIAYHEDKFQRGYNEVIDVWGADHHGHIKRMKAVKEMLGWEGEFVIFVTQLIGIKEAGEHKKLSKREGTVILLEDLVQEYGIDVVRWFFLEKAVTTHMDFDTDRAKEQSEKNPVFYVQYAHARMCSIKHKCADLTADNTTIADIMDDTSARALAMKLVEFQEVIETIAGDYQVHRLTTYAYELASTFSQFYRDVRVIEDETFNSGAYALLEGTRATLAKTLSLLGINAPEEM